MNQREIFFRHLAQTSPAPLALQIERAEGMYLYDAAGKSYLDLIGGISVCNTGHRHPDVVEAIRKQADLYLHILVYGEMIESPQIEYAQLLTSRLPPSLESVYFTNSGAEAVEGAMKLAKRVTGRTQIIAFNRSYHGSTQGALSILGDEYWRSAFRPLLPDILHLDYNSFDQLEQISEHTACVIAETVQAEAGVIKPSFAKAAVGEARDYPFPAGGNWSSASVYPFSLSGGGEVPDGEVSEGKSFNGATAPAAVRASGSFEGGSINPNWLQALRKKCDATGALLVLDEIQTGFGRTGTLWGFEQYGVVPDILLLGKALGGGLPLGAFIAPKKLMDELMDKPVLGHITTFGGHPLSCAAGLASLKVLLKEQLAESVAEKEKLFHRLLVHPSIKSVRSAGLLIAVAFESFEKNKQVIDYCLQRGQLTDWFLFAPDCLRICPPLIISKQEIGEACGVVVGGAERGLTVDGS